MNWNFLKRARKNYGGVLGMLMGGDALGMSRTPGAFIREGYADNPVVYKCISLVARGVATLPIYVAKGDKAVDGHPSLAVMERPNPRMAGAQLLEEVVTDYLATGNAYLRKIVVGKDKVRELWRLPAFEMTVKEGDFGMVGSFEHRRNGQKVTFDVDPITGASEVAQFRTANPLSMLYGLSPLNAAALAIDCHTAASKWNFKLLRNGARNSGVLVHKPGGDEENLTDQQRVKLKEDLARKWGGAGGSEQGGVMLLEGSFDFKETSLSPKDMDWTNSKHSAASEIALCLGVPGQLVGIPDAQTYANNEEARLALYLFTILPLADYFLGELSRFMLAPGERFEIDRDDIEALMPLRDKKWAQVSAAAGAPLISINEARNEVGFEPVKGGDEILTASSLLPLGTEAVPPVNDKPPTEAAKVAYGT